MNGRCVANRCLHGLLLLLVLAALAPAQAGFVHPGITQNRQELEFMKQKVLAGEQPWKGAWDRLRAANYSSLNFQPKPFAHVIRGPYGKPKIGADELASSATASYSHALQWYVTGDQAHAQKVIEIFNAWAPVLEDFQENDAKLLAGWTGYEFCNAAEILRSSDSGWTETDIAKFKKMLLGVYYPLLKDYFPEANGNWDAAIMSTLLSIGIFCEDQAMFDRVVEHYLRGPLNGGITHYVYPSGQCQESTRDHNHTQLGLEWMAKTAQVAWTQGVDLFGTADNRLALGFEYTASYLSGVEVPAENVISARMRFSDVYLPIYQHYHIDKGLDMPNTKLAVDRTMDRASLTVLTQYRGPSANPPPKLAAPQPSALASQGGALREASAPAPAGAIVVAPGPSIQAALDAQKAQGGWVVLSNGVHTLSAALLVPSGVTLAGQGVGTVVWMKADLKGPAILNADENLHDVTLRDFVLEGAGTTTLPSDPNSARRNRSRPNAPSRGGIQLRADVGKTLSNIRLEHVTVRNCTETGLDIENARQIVLAGCSFTDNGASVPPGAKSWHNVSLRQVQGCEITGTRLNNSPAGSGLDLAGSRDVTLSANEIARNVLHGVHATGTEDLHLRNNLAEGNEAGGIVLDASTAPCQRVEVVSNLLQNNDGYGIQVTRALGGTIQGNRLLANAHADQISLVGSENIRQ
jgi:hypothetical protein